MKRRKPATERKEVALKIRLSDRQKREIEEAARTEEQDVSGWIRRITLREAKLVLETR